MYFLETYLKGCGLNLTNETFSKYPPVKNYYVYIIEKYDFILLDFENCKHVESDFINLSKMIKPNGFLVIRKKINKHLTEYNEVLFHVDLFEKYKLGLVKFETEDEYYYFTFKKQTFKEVIDVALVGYSFDTIKNAIKELAESELSKYYHFNLTIYGDKDYWNESGFYDKLPKFTQLWVYPSSKEMYRKFNCTAHNWQYFVSRTTCRKLFFIDDTFKKTDFCLSKKYSKNYIFVEDRIKFNRVNGLDYKYESLEWVIYDLSVRMGELIKQPEINSYDIDKFNKKKEKGLLDGSVNWINIHEALGDNICAFNLIETIKRDKPLRVGTIYPFLYTLSQDIQLNHNCEETVCLGHNVYNYGSTFNSKTLEYAYFSMYGYEDRIKNMRRKYFYNPDTVEQIKNKYKDKQIVLIAPYASNREGPSNGVQKSNKTWEYKRWEKVIDFLHSKNYYVIQVGAKEDEIVSNIDETFFNQPFSDLVALIKVSKFFLSLDTFFQHLCGLMEKKGIVITPDYNDHINWSSVIYIVGKNGKKFEELRWIKDHLNPYRKICMENISVETVIKETSKLIDCFNKY
jgi:hypothetical protein